MIPDNISTGTSVALHCGGYSSAIDAMKGNRYLDPELDSWGSVKATVRMNVGEINPHVRRPGCLMAVRFALPSPTGPLDEATRLRRGIRIDDGPAYRRNVWLPNVVVAVDFHSSKPLRKRPLKLPPHRRRLSRPAPERLPGT